TGVQTCALPISFGLLAALISLGMLTLHGATYLQVRTDCALHERARKAGVLLGVLVAVLFGVAGFWVAGMDGYVMTASADVGAAMSPLQKTAELQAGAWLQNYSQYPLAILAPIVGFSGLLLASLFSLLNRGDRKSVG